MITVVLRTIMLFFVASTAFAADTSDLPQNDVKLWRASQVIGVPILDPFRNTAGKVADILISRDGKTQFIIIGVGGTFGYGEKKVAIPFGQIRFTNKEIVPPPNPTTMSSTEANVSAPGTLPAGGVAGQKTDFADQAGDTTPRSVGHPDHGTIDMTADQLKGLPSYHPAGG